MTTPSNGQLLTLARLLELQEQTRDVPVDGFGLVRLQLLDAADKLHLISQLQEIEQTPEGQIVNQRDTLEFSLSLLALAIVDENGHQAFRSDAGQRAIARLPLAVIQELATAAIGLNGLGPDAVSIDAAIADVKKN